MIDHNHFICHFIFGGHLLNIPNVMARINSAENLFPGRILCESYIF